MSNDLPATLITGASRRIGQAIATDLARHGYPTLIHANSSMAAAEALAVQLREEGHTAHAIGGNLLDPGQLSSVVERAAEHFGPIGLLVNNASIFLDDAIGTLDHEVWDTHFAIHVKAPVFLSEAFVKQLPADNPGMIINMVDQRVRRLTPKFHSYTLSKAALWTATQTMAMALAPQVRVNAIGPGPTLKNARQSEADFQQQVDSILLKRAAGLDEFGATIRHLWQSPSITGQLITIDGGQHLAWETPDVAGVPE